MPTTSRAIAIRKGGGSSKPRRLMRASSPAGIRVDPSRRARAPQMRGDNEGCAAGLAPRALFFAARSPVRERKIASIPKKALVDHISRLRALGLGARVIDVLE